jgi:hypothetical protein
MGEAICAAPNRHDFGDNRARLLSDSTPRFRNCHDLSEGERVEVFLDWTARTGERGLLVIEMNELRTLSQLPAPVVTAYLDTSSAEPSNRGPVPAYLTWLNATGKAMAETLTPDQQKLFRAQVERIESFLRDHVSQQRGLLIFAGPEAWRVVALELEVENELHWGGPSLTQLLWLYDEHRPHGIAVVDRAGARFFRYRLGDWTALGEKDFRIDISQWRKKDLGKVAQPGIRKTRGSQHDDFDRRMDAQYARLCSETAEQIGKLCENEGFLAIFLVGSERLIRPIEAAFPTDLRRKVVLIDEDVATVIWPKLEQRLEPKIAKWEVDHEMDVVNALLGDTRGAILGIDETLPLLQKGKMRSVVVAGDLDTRLGQCTGCGWADRAVAPSCPVCGGERREVSLREALPEIAWKREIDIDVVTGEAAEKLKDAGGIGGWLRVSGKSASKRRERRVS